MIVKFSIFILSYVPYQKYTEIKFEPLQTCCKTAVGVDMNGTAFWMNAAVFPGLLKKDKLDVSVKFLMTRRRA